MNFAKAREGEIQISSAEGKSKKRGGKDYKI